MSEINSISFLADETESFLEDIFLSGFHNLWQSIFESLAQLLKMYETYDMKEGYYLLSQLNKQLTKHQKSFIEQVSETMKAYCQVEFYVQHLKSQLGGTY